MRSFEKKGKGALCVAPMHLCDKTEYGPPNLGTIAIAADIDLVLHRLFGRMYLMTTSRPAIILTSWIAEVHLFHKVAPQAEGVRVCVAGIAYRDDRSKTHLWLVLTISTLFTSSSISFSNADFIDAFPIR